MHLYKKTLISSFVALTLIGCGGGGSDSNGNASAGGDSSQQQPVTSLLSIIIPSAIAEEAPPGTEIKVKITGNGVDLEKAILASESNVSFNDLVIGEYTVAITVYAGDTVLASDTQTVEVTEDSTELEAQLALNKASLTVTPLFASDYSFLTGSFEGEFNKDGCLDLPFNPANTDISISVSGLAAELEFSFFPNPVIKMTGDLNDSMGQLQGSGTYQSSDFTNGTWTISKILQPSETTVFISGQLVDATNDNCTIDFEYIGTNMGGIDMGL